MQNLKLGVLCLSLWTIIPRLSRAEEFLYLPITRTPIITAGFCGYRNSTGSCHGGIDYDTRDDGDGIFAAAEGVVEATVDGRPNTYLRHGEYGNSIRIRHPNGYLTIYGHLKTGSLAVRVGDAVRAGTLLGMGDNSGWSSGSHLHFEVRDPSGRKVDPYGESPTYPNCGTNALWVICPPVSPADVDQDRDGYNMLEDCDDGNGNVNPGATELCNGRDENCDGLTDDRWAALGTSCAVTPVPGCERSGTWVCSADENTIVCNADTTVGAERCDGLDNDCDGQTDEDWRTGLAIDLGQPCEVGVGECRRSGVFICTPDGLGVVCDADYVSGTREVCDGLDNDCDGETDNICLCEAAHPHPSCVCHECDISCPVSEDYCLVVGLNPDSSIIHTCEFSYGCYMCGSRPGTGGRTCVYCMNCLWACSEFCINPAYAFCSDYCPSP